MLEVDYLHLIQECERTFDLLSVSYVFLWYIGFLNHYAFQVTPEQVKMIERETREQTGSK